MARRITILTIFGVLVLFSNTPAARQAASAVEIEKLFAAVGVTEGATVCEVGAGNGELSVAAARLVGSAGRVYTNELGEGAVKTLRSRTAASGLGQITVVAGDPQRTNFPDAACDTVFMRNVYHHFTDPAAMNASIAAALKPGGRLVVVDFGPNGREASTAAARANNASHGVGTDTVSRELKAAGFDVVSAESGAQRWLMVVAKKPDGGAVFVPGA